MYQGIFAGWGRGNVSQVHNNSQNHILRSIYIHRFRWVALQLSALNNCNNADEVTMQLETLPPDLNESYRQFFAKLNPHHHHIVLTIMQWLAFSEVSLSVEQICEAVAIVKVGEDQCPKYQPGKKWNRLSVTEVCADLVTVVYGNISLYTHCKIYSPKSYRRDQIGTFHCERVSYGRASQV